MSMNSLLVSMLSEIYGEDVLFLAKIRTLRSNSDSNNEIWKVFDPNRVQIHEDPTFVVNLFCYTFVGIVFSECLSVCLSICCGECVCMNFTFDVVRTRDRERRAV